jgi:hypothetical protein
MTTAVIVHEVEKPNLRNTRLTNSGRFFDWFESYPFFASVGLRQFGLGSSELLRKSVVWTAPESNGQLMFVISNRKKLNLFCHVIFGDEVTDTKLNDLRRPGLAATKILSSSLGLTLKTDLNIYSTTVSVESERTIETASLNGWALLKDSRQQQSAVLAMTLMIGVGVAIERALVNQAQVLSASGKRNLWAYQPILHRLRAWSSLPPIDNTALAAKYLELRDSLHLELRREEALKTLELKERNLGVLLGLLGAVAGILVSLFALRL